MEVDPTDRPRLLVEADVIEALEARSGDSLDPVIRHQKVLLPPHEQVFALLVVLQCEVGRLGGLCERSPGGKARPVLQVDFFAAAPGGMGGFEEVFWADDFALKESR